MELNEVIGLAEAAANGSNDFAQMRWSKYMDNNKEFKRPDLWTIKMLSPAPAIYYPGDEVINARLDTCKVTRTSWDYKMGDSPTIRGYKPLGGQPSGFADMSGSVSMSFVDKQDYAIELWIKSTRDLISHPETRFSYPIELLMSQVELSYHNTVQKRVKVHTFFNCVPTSGTVAEDDPANGDVSWSAGYDYTWKFPWHKEEYINLY